MREGERERKKGKTNLGRFIIHICLSAITVKQDTSSEEENEREKRS